jgi:ribosomal protein L13E
LGAEAGACVVLEQRTHHQITGEPMKLLTLATVRYPVLEMTATVEPFQNGRGFSLRVLRAGKPRAQPN